jgi:hypothetical protein
LGKRLHGWMAIALAAVQRWREDQELKWLDEVGWYPRRWGGTILVIGAMLAFGARLLVIACLAPVGALLLLIYTLFALQLLGTVYKVGWNSSTIQYVLSHGINPLDIVAPPMPHDCDFMRAPIGNKYCRYTFVPFEDGKRLYVSWYKEAL